MTEKIQKILAQTGLGSRREIESWIRQGRITLNGKLAVIGDRMTHHDKISMDGREVKLLKSSLHKTRILLYNKSEGELCTRNDPEGRPTIFEKLPMIRNSRWISVGRLDFNTSGLLLLTNDGELAHKLMHPSSNLEREYAVRIRGHVTDQSLTRLKKGVTLEDGPAKFEKIMKVGGSDLNHWYHVIVKEGRNRLVRRLWEALGLTVSRLIRIRFGPIYLPQSLPRGKHKELPREEIIKLMDFMADRLE